MAIPSDAVLTRKLRELEDVLRGAFVSRHSESTGEKKEGEEDAAAAPPSADDINRRIEFLKNLLCAEMESRRGSKPAHLFHIAERLAFLEEARERWAEGISSPDTLSTCSCPNSSFNEEEEEPEEQEAPLIEPPGEALPSSRGKKEYAARAAALLAAAAAVALFAAAIFLEDDHTFLVPT